MRPLISSLLRLRQELSKLILKHTEKTDDPGARSTTQGRFYELLLNGLSVSCPDWYFSIHLTGHPCVERLAAKCPPQSTDRDCLLAGEGGRAQKADDLHQTWWKINDAAFPCEFMVTIFPIAIIDTIMVFHNGKEAAQISGKITTSYTIEQWPSSGG